MNRIKKKYIIELEDKPFHKGNGDFLYRVKGFNSLVFDMTGINKLIPYTEPDFDAVKKEVHNKCMSEAEDLAYKLYSPKIDEAYQRGLNDAWECARKIWQSDIYLRIFKVPMRMDCFTKFSASEAIEKIRQYEQEKEEIKVGNEVKSDDEKYIVLQKYLNNIDELMVVLFNRRDGQIGTWHMYNANGAIFEKTGRHFPEIVEALKKMREG